MEKETFEIEVEEPLGSIRLDKFLAMHQSFSRTKIEHMIEEGRVLVNGQKQAKSYQPKMGDVIQVEPYQIQDQAIVAENIPLDIVFEDDAVLVINKPLGMVVHPAPGHYSGTLVNALLYHFKHLSNQNGENRPGIVHRIDKDTTGLLVVAKTNQAHEALARQLQVHSMKRKYYALVQGILDEPYGKIVARIGRSPVHRQMMAVTSDGKEAITHFTVKQRYQHYTFLEVELETGRTHQIRVHMHYIGHPIEGDPLYFKQKNHLFDGGQLLHAFQISFDHPLTQKRMTFEVPLPEHFKNLLKDLT